MLAQSCPTLLRPYGVTQQAPLSMAFLMQEYWNGLPFPPPGNFSDPGIEPTSLAFLHWQAGSLPTEP